MSDSLEKMKERLKQDPNASPLPRVKPDSPQSLIGGEKKLDAEAWDCIQRAATTSLEDLRASDTTLPKPLSLPAELRGITNWNELFSPPTSASVSAVASPATSPPVTHSTLVSPDLNSPAADSSTLIFTRLSSAGSVDSHRSSDASIDGDPLPIPKVDDDNDDATGVSIKIIHV